jgi:acetyl-CoA acyltransferase
MEAVIVDCLRTAIGKAPKGTLRNTRPDDLAAFVFQALLKRYPQVASNEIDDVILGCAFPEGEAGMNFARAVALRAGLPNTVPALTINRFCSSGLQAIAIAADRIRSGGADIIIAGGAESMSMIPMTGNKLAPNPWLVDNLPQLYMGMGLTAECVRKQYGVTREQADQFDLRSHQKAIAAQAAGNFDEEIVPVEVESTVFNGRPKNVKAVFNKDEGPRADTSVEALARLKPAFQTGGIVTAGNSSQTSDGAAAAMSGRRRSWASNRWPVSSRSQSAACPRRSWGSVR